jgi:hypothetical protein
VDAAAAALRPASYRIGTGGQGASALLLPVLAGRSGWPVLPDVEQQADAAH